MEMRKFKLDEKKAKTAEQAMKAREGYNAAKAAESETRMKLFNSFMGGADGTMPNLPPGSQMSVGGLTIPLNRKYTESESRTLASSDAILKDLSELKSMYGDKNNNITWAQWSNALSKIPAIGSLIYGLSGETAQNFKDLSKNISERLLRLRSGAQINESEYRRFVEMMPSLFRQDKLDIKQMDRFINEFTSLQGRIQKGYVWDKNKKEFTGGQEQSPVTLNMDSSEMPDDDAYAEYLKMVGE
jgi:hypothetical protein